MFLFNHSNVWFSCYYTGCSPSPKPKRICVNDCFLEIHVNATFDVNQKTCIHNEEVHRICPSESDYFILPLIRITIK